MIVSEYVYDHFIARWERRRPTEEITSVFLAGCSSSHPRVLSATRFLFFPPSVIVTLPSFRPSLTDLSSLFSSLPHLPPSHASCYETNGRLNWVV